MSNGKVVLGVLAGLAAGAILGILFAPDKGDETRKKIAKKGKDYTDDLKHKVNELVSDATSKFEATLKKAKDEESKVAGHI